MVKESFKRMIGRRLILGEDLDSLVVEFPQLRRIYWKLKKNIALYFRDIRDNMNK